MFDKLHYMAFKLFSFRGVLCAVACALLLHCTTLLWSPIAWTDECMIVEYGRILWENDHDASMNLGPGGEVVPELSGPAYLGCLAHYLAYKLCGYSAAGPRLFALFAFGCFVLLAYKLLEMRTRKAGIAAFFALLFLVDPWMNMSVRGARCDALAFSFWLACLFAIEKACRAMADTNVSFTPGIIWNAISGLFLVLCVLTWTTAYMAVLTVAAYAIMACLENKLPYKKVFWLFLSACVGAFATLGIAALFYPGDVSICLNLFPTLLSHSSGNSQFVSGHLDRVEIWENIKIYIGLVKLSPFLYFSGILILIGKWKYRWLWLALYCISMLVFLRTMFYVFRIIYLLPMMLVMAGAFWADLKFSPRVGRFIPYLAVLYIAGLFVYYIVGRNAQAFWQCRERSAKWLETQLAKSEINANPKANIYVDERRLYYIGRKLGWKQYCNFLNKPSETTRQYDFYVFSNPQNISNNLEFCKKYKLLQRIESQIDSKFYGNVEIWKFKEN